jgi:hypothetical protein
MVKVKVQWPKSNDVLTPPFFWLSLAASSKQYPQPLPPKGLVVLKQVWFSKPSLFITSSLLSPPFPMYFICWEVERGDGTCPVVAGERGSYGGKGCLWTYLWGATPRLIRLLPYRVSGTFLMTCLHKGQLSSFWVVSTLLFSKLCLKSGVVVCKNRGQV